MPDFSPRLKLPYILPAQAQKHVPHNEAIQLLDSLTQLVVQRFGALTPPGGPQAGQVWALGESPTGDWAGQGGNLAVAANGGWMFIPPTDGVRAWGLAERQLQVFQDGAWQAANGALQRLEQLGISTDADSGNRLSVASEASLFTHAGAGHQMKLNKAATGDTASLLFQTNYTGHAEIGLAGDDALSVKVSANGTDWHEALRADAGAGAITLSPTGTPRATLSDSGLMLDGALSGAAVQADPLDAGAGKVLTSGAFGLGTAAALPGGDVDAAVLGGVYQGFAGANAAASTGDNPFPTETDAFTLTVTSNGPDSWVQIATLLAPGAPQIRIRSRAGASLGAWSSLTHSGNAGGPLAQGGVVESASNANGRYTRFADGTQICTIKRLELAYFNAASCSGPWTFPAAFSTTDDLNVQVSLLPYADGVAAPFCASAAAPNAGDIGALSYGELTTSSAGISVQRVTGTTNFVAGNKMFVSVTAQGRWQ